MNAVVCSCTPRRARSAPGARAGSRPSTDTDPDDAVRRPFEDLDERGLAGAVGAEQADDLSGGRDREIDAAERVDRAVGLRSARTSMAIMVQLGCQSAVRVREVPDVSLKVTSVRVP